MKNFTIIIPILFPFILAIIMATIKLDEKKRNIFVSIGVILNLIFLVTVFYMFGQSTLHLLKINEFLDIYFKIDKLSILFSLLVAILWIFTAFYAMEYMKHEGKERRFYTFFLATLGVTMGIAFSGNLITLYAFYEFLTLSTFPLVIHTGSKQALKSGKKYLIYSFIGATMVLLGMVLLFSVTKNTTFNARGILPALTNDNRNRYIVSYIAMFLGFGVKAALVPFHSWLPAAMVAPTPVSALLHAVAVVKSGIFAIMRMSYFIFGTEIIKALHVNIFLSILIVISILLGSFLALHQENLKKRLAYSTISQLGYVLLGVVLLNKDAFAGSLLHLINHAVIKIVLFFCVGAIMYTTGKTDISQIRGIGKQMPITMGCFGIAAISLIGIPPSNGFVSKWYLAQGGLTEGKMIFPAILLISALLTALYLLPIVTEAFFKKGEDTVVKEAPMKMLIPIVMITIIIVLLGIFPNMLITFVQKIASEVI
ncbi:monovalent cation/H+ antiporter subunit D family protein [Clostridium bowmanii]|uniref:complex I subunit 5 family protein n=1 Tax=Clostridium bowmanii TaxID=132925 RepID=UPI001C0BB593|nr:proton-conducting transporter membrane subunit [Clostridium bowmanii]MBU3189291.1 monovalent cation/H+ antiporter subunit D family protein [Clostridium bowmanii]MCA1073175.1 monovalent cation/H+ antiporter subunit D family protein [Clostridium bowmanii]